MCATVEPNLLPSVHHPCNHAMSAELLLGVLSFAYEVTRSPRVLAVPPNMPAGTATAPVEPDWSRVLSTHH